MFQPWLESPKVGGKSPQLKFFSMVFIRLKSPSLVLKSLQRGAPSDFFLAYHPASTHDIYLKPKSYIHLRLLDHISYLKHTSVSQSRLKSHSIHVFLA